MAGDAGWTRSQRCQHGLLRQIVGLTRRRAERAQVAPDAEPTAFRLFGAGRGWLLGELGHRHAGRSLVPANAIQEIWLAVQVAADQPATPARWCRMDVWLRYDGDANGYGGACRRPSLLAVCWPCSPCWVAGMCNLRHHQVKRGRVACRSRSWHRNQATRRFALSSRWRCILVARDSRKQLHNHSDHAC